MKTAKNLLIAIAMAAALTPAIQLQAQTANGITASPKVRELFYERQTVASTVSTPSTTVAANDRIVASPKLREQLDAQKKVAVASSSVDLARAKTDGIAASPKFREQMGPRVATFQVAPIK